MCTIHDIYGCIVYSMCSIGETMLDSNWPIITNLTLSIPWNLLQIFHTLSVYIFIYIYLIYGVIVTFLWVFSFKRIANKSFLWFSYRLERFLDIRPLRVYIYHISYLVEDLASEYRVKYCVNPFLLFADRILFDFPFQVKACLWEYCINLFR